jgi:glutamyl-Q tRNA(Asp) synthetase
MEFATRFAPSPTGLLHLGHAFSALTGWRMARAAGGRFALRIEDIDTTRCRPAFEAAIFEDLAWLGIDWDGPVWRQSERLPVYAGALQRLRDIGVAYPCFCTRADIAAAGGAPQGPEGPLYPGTCRGLSDAEVAAKSGTPAWRLDVSKAAVLTGPLHWDDAAAGVVPAAPERLGDFVLARRDIGAAYHLAVVVDDAAQGITNVVRGRDLFEATHVQRLLQALLGLPAPRYYHHALVTGADGKRLAKRDGGSTIAAARAAGEDPAALAERLLARWGGGAA